MDAIGTDYTDLDELASLGLDAEELAILRDAEDVRCGTPDPSQYHDPTQIYLEATGRSITDHLGQRRGLTGVVIPRATRGGGSQGFDPNRPAHVNVINLKSGTTCSLDLSAVSSSQTHAAVDPNLSGDLGAVAAIAFGRLARMQGAATLVRDEAELLETVEEPRRPPVGMSGYVVPKSLGGGRQVQTSAAKPRTRQRQPVVQEQSIAVQSEAPASPRSVSFARAQPRALSDRASAPAEAGVPAPALQVHFEHKDVYEMVAPFHAVACSDLVLVLVFDTRYTQGNRFEPKPTDEPIFIQVVGRPEIYRVYVSGEKYLLGTAEHQLFFIDEVFTATGTP